MDAANNEKIVGYFIEEANEHLETLESGILDLREAINDEETVNELFRAAHSIKGGAAMLSFKSISETAHRLEDAFKILRDEPLEVDKTLEGLFLKAYDVLKDLVDRLQAPSGLKEEDAQKIRQKAEPDFVNLQKYLEKITGKESSEEIPLEFPPEPTPTPAKRTFSGDFLAEIKQSLKEMLAIFKQQPTPENRQDLLDLCDNLAQLYQDEMGWQNLIEVSQKAIANPKHSYRLLAPVIIKEIKVAGDCLDVGRGSEVTPSQGLEQLANAELPLILLNLELESAAQTLTKVFNKQQLSKLVQMLQSAQ